VSIGCGSDDRGWSWRGPVAPHDPVLCLDDAGPRDGACGRATGCVGGCWHHSRSGLGRLYGSGFNPGDVRDVDVAFFGPDDLGRDGDEQATRRLHDAWSQVPWQARNQAAVHTWYASKFGGDPVRPLLTIADAVATWPETATAVAVRLGPADEVELCAPLGMTDLLAGVWRRNPRRVSVPVSLARFARHQAAKRWPGVKVIPPG
jgi:uncharacterized protein